MEDCGNVFRANTAGDIGNVVKLNLNIRESVQEQVVSTDIVDCSDEANVVEGERELVAFLQTHGAGPNKEYWLCSLGTDYTGPRCVKQLSKFIGYCESVVCDGTVVQLKKGSTNRATAVSSLPPPPPPPPPATIPHQPSPQPPPPPPLTIADQPSPSSPPALKRMASQAEKIALSLSMDEAEVQTVMTKLGNAKPRQMATLVFDAHPKNFTTLVEAIQWEMSWKTKSHVGEIVSTAAMRLVWPDAVVKELWRLEDERDTADKCLRQALAEANKKLPRQRRQPIGPVNNVV